MAAADPPDSAAAAAHAALYYRTPQAGRSLTSRGVSPQSSAATMAAVKQHVEQHHLLHLAEGIVAADPVGRESSSKPALSAGQRAAKGSRANAMSLVAKGEYLALQSPGTLSVSEYVQHAQDTQCSAATRAALLGDAINDAPVKGVLFFTSDGACNSPVCTCRMLLQLLGLDKDEDKPRAAAALARMGALTQEARVFDTMTAPEAHHDACDVRRLVLGNGHDLQDPVCDGCSMRAAIACYYKAATDQVICIECVASVDERLYEAAKARDHRPSGAGAAAAAGGDGAILQPLAAGALLAAEPRLQEDQWRLVWLLRPKAVELLELIAGLDDAHTHAAAQQLADQLKASKGERADCWLTALRALSAALSAPLSAEAREQALAAATAAAERFKAAADKANIPGAHKLNVPSVAAQDYIVPPSEQQRAFDHASRELLDGAGQPLLQLAVGLAHFYGVPLTTRVPQDDLSALQQLLHEDAIFKGSSSSGPYTPQATRLWAELRAAPDEFINVNLAAEVKTSTGGTQRKFRPDLLRALLDGRALSPGDLVALGYADKVTQAEASDANESLREHGHLPRRLQVINFPISEQLQAVCPALAQRFEAAAAACGAALAGVSHGPGQQQGLEEMEVDVPAAGAAGAAAAGERGRVWANALAACACDSPLGLDLLHALLGHYDGIKVYTNGGNVATWLHSDDMAAINALLRARIPARVLDAYQTGALRQDTQDERAVAAVWVFVHRRFHKQLCKLLVPHLSKQDQAAWLYPLRSSIRWSLPDLLRHLGDAGIPVSIIYQRQGDAVHVPTGAAHAVYTPVASFKIAADWCPDVAAPHQFACTQLVRHFGRQASAAALNCGGGDGVGDANADRSMPSLVLEMLLGALAERADSQQQQQRDKEQIHSMQQEQSENDASSSGGGDSRQSAGGPQRAAAARLFSFAEDAHFRYRRVPYQPSPARACCCSDCQALAAQHAGAAQRAYAVDAREEQERAAQEKAAREAAAAKAASKRGTRRKR